MKKKKDWKCLTCKKEVPEDRDVCQDCLDKVIKGDRDEPKTN